MFIVCGAELMNAKMSLTHHFKLQVERTCDDCGLLVAVAKSEQCRQVGSRLMA
jgi:hypothetical protein